MNRRNVLIEISLATASLVIGTGLSTATQVESAVAFRPLPDNQKDGGRNKKRRRKGRGNGNGNGNKK